MVPPTTMRMIKCYEHYPMHLAKKNSTNSCIVFKYKIKWDDMDIEMKEAQSWHNDGRLPRPRGALQHEYIFSEKGQPKIDVGQSLRKNTKPNRLYTLQ